ncbi:MAG: hypothetical protein J0I92_20365, partial [Phyllobacterium sp.]|nr:hypothetical protein [Phyllobacterium sp.]
FLIFLTSVREVAPIATPSRRSGSRSHRGTAHAKRRNEVEEGEALARVPGSGRTEAGRVAWRSPFFFPFQVRSGVGTKDMLYI